MFIPLVNHVWNNYFKFNYSLDNIMFRNVRYVVISIRVLVYAILGMIIDYEWFTKIHLFCCVVLLETCLEIFFQVYHAFFVSNVDVLQVLCHSVLGPGKYAAVMYFYGYLQKILPDSEYAPHPDLAKRIRAYQEDEKETIAVKKLFILNPKSGRTEPVIGKNSDMIKMRKGLHPLELQRSGVGQRTYNQSVYQLFLEDGFKRDRKYVNVVAEYASPLATIKELSQVLVEGKKLLECNLSTFTEHLNLLLEENPDCGKYCHLITFDDKKEDAVTALRNHVLQILKIPPTKNEVPEKFHLSYNDERSLENDQLLISNSN